MAKRCVLVEVGDQLSGAMNDFATFNAQFHGFAGRKQLGSSISRLVLPLIQFLVFLFPWAVDESTTISVSF